MNTLCSSIVWPILLMLVWSSEVKEERETSFRSALAQFNKNHKEVDNNEIEVVIPHYMEPIRDAVQVLKKAISNSENADQLKKLGVLFQKYAEIIKKSLIEFRTNIKMTEKKLANDRTYIKIFEGKLRAAQRQEEEEEKIFGENARYFEKGMDTLANQKDSIHGEIISQYLTKITEHVTSTLNDREKEYNIRNYNERTEAKYSAEDVKTLHSELLESEIHNLVDMLSDLYEQTKEFEKQARKIFL